MKTYPYRFPVVKMYSPSSTGIEYVCGSLSVDDDVIYFTGHGTAAQQLCGRTTLARNIIIYEN